MSLINLTFLFSIWLFDSRPDSILSGVVFLIVSSLNKKIVYPKIVKKRDNPPRASSDHSFLILTSRFAYLLLILSPAIFIDFWYEYYLSLTFFEPLGVFESSVTFWLFG